MMTVSVFFIAYLAFSSAASLTGEPLFWGVGSWGIVSPAAGIAAAAISLLMLRKRFHETALDRTRNSSRRRFGELVLLMTAAPLLFWIFRMHHAFWGEGRAIGLLLDRGAAGPASAPLAMLLNRLFFKFLNGVFLLDGFGSTAVVSIICGLLFVLASKRTAAALTEGRSERRPLTAAFLLILCGGGSAVFFGMGGIAPLVAVSTILFLLASISCTRGQTPLYLPALLLVVSIFLRLPAVYLLPGFIVTTAGVLADPGRRKELAPAATALIGAWIALEGIIYFSTRTSPTMGLAGAFPGALLRATGEGPTWSIGYWADLAGAMLVIGPCAITAVILFPAWRISRDEPRRGALRGEELVLLVHALAALFILIAGARRIDGGLRMDTLAPTAIPLALYTAWSLKGRFPVGKRFAKAATLIALAGLYQLVPIVIMNASTQLASRRLVSLPIIEGAGEMLIGNRAVQEHEEDAARTWFLGAIERNPDLSEAHFGLGNIYLEDDLDLDAITSFQSALELEPENLEYRMGLAEAFIAKRWFEEAIGVLEHLVLDHPDSARIWKRLGYAQNHGGWHADAIGSYERVAELDPGGEGNIQAIVSAVLNSGAKLQGEQKYDEARALYERAIGLYPESWVAFNNLAALEMELENYDAAYRILEKAIRFHPYASSLNFNIGITLEKLGKDREALEYLQKSAELDPMYSKAGPHIERLTEKLSKQEDADR